MRVDIQEWKGDNDMRRSLAGLRETHLNKQKGKIMIVTQTAKSGEQKEKMMAGK